VAARLRGLSRLFSIAATAFSLLFATVTFLPILGPWTNALTSPWSQSGGDTLVVLGAEQVAGNMLGLGSYWRSVYAVYEWRTGSYRQILFSGAAGTAEAMRDFAVAQGVPASATRLETRSYSTREQALYVSELLRGSRGRVVLLTSDFHSLRAYRTFVKCGLDVRPIPVPDAGKRVGTLSARWNVFLDLSLETTKFLWYRFQGWI